MSNVYRTVYYEKFIDLDHSSKKPKNSDFNTFWDACWDGSRSRDGYDASSFISSTSPSSRQRVRIYPVHRQS